MRFFCLVNPVSGGRSGTELIRKLRSLCRLEYPDSRVLETDPGNIRSQLEESREFDLIVVAGGDGTVSKIVRNAVPDMPRLAVFPLGTGDDLSRELGTYSPSRSLSLDDWLGWCQRARLRELDIWSLQPVKGVAAETSFCNYLSIGFDAAVVLMFHRWRARFPGVSALGGKWANRAGYALAGLRCLFGAELGSTEIAPVGDSALALPKQRGVMFASIRSCMGLGRSNMQSNFSDGKLEAVTVGSALNYCAMLAPWLPIPSASLAGSASAWDLRLSRNCPLQADGEPVGELAPGSYRIVHRGAVSVVVGG